MVYKLHHHLEFSFILQTDKSLVCSAGISQMKGKLVSCTFLECVWGWPASNQLWKKRSFHFHVTLRTQTDFISHTLEILTDKIHSSIFFPLSTSGSQGGWSLAQLLIGDKTSSFKKKKKLVYWYKSSLTSILSYTDATKTVRFSYLVTVTKTGTLTTWRLPPKPAVRLIASDEAEPKILSPSNICRAHKQSFDCDRRSATHNIQDSKPPLCACVAGCHCVAQTIREAAEPVLPGLSVKTGTLFGSAEPLSSTLD